MTKGDECSKTRAKYATEVTNPVLALDALYGGIVLKSSLAAMQKA